ncbi:MAG: hypothetical protein K2N48_08885 [Muribaculaceae bacterium]|nr:hypothetical protein [Muribaculaceae bacterium]
MKQYLIRIMALVIILFVSLLKITVNAEDLHVDPFLKEDFAKNPSVTMVSMSGKQSDWKGLTSYRSVSISGDDTQADAMARAVRKDGVKAEFKETTFKDGRLYFGFYGLGGEGRHRRYLFFLDMRLKGKSKTTLINIEADLTPEQVKQMIKK